MNYMSSVFHKLYLEKVKNQDLKIDYEKIKTDSQFYNTYLTAVISSINWVKGLPVGMPISMHEEMLQTCGQTALFKDEEEYLLLPAFGSGSLTRYGLFDRYTMFDATGKTYERNISDIELCFNNVFKIPYSAKIYDFALKTSYIYRAIQCSLKKAQQPNIWSIEDESDIPLVEAFNDEKYQLKANVALPKSKFSQANSAKVSPYDNREIDIISMWDIYVRQRNLFYTTFGFNNVEIQKRERLTEAEGSGNDEIVRFTLLSDMVNQRTDFVNRVKNHFGIEMDFEINRDVATVFSLTTSNVEKIKMAKLNSLKGVNTEIDGGEVDESDDGNVDE